MIKNIIFLFFLILGCSDADNENIFIYDVDINKAKIGYPVNLNIALNNMDEYYTDYESDSSSEIIEEICECQNDTPITDEGLCEYCQWKKHFFSGSLEILPSSTGCPCNCKRRMMT